MTNSGTLLTFILVSFAFALVLIFKKDSIPHRAKRPMALLALVMIVLAFGFIVYSFFTMSQ